MQILSKIQPILEKGFPENWLDNKSAKELKKELPIIISEINEEIFDVFCQSVLSGEYVLETDEEIKSFLDKLLIFIKQHFDFFGDEASIQKVLDKNVKNRLVDFLDTLISYYRQFVGNISLLTTNSFLDISIRFGNDRVSSYNLSDELKQKINLFVIYLEVQLSDHFFSDDEGLFEQLTILLRRLKKSKTPSRLKASIIEKINFLKHKWILRQYYYSIDDDSINYKGYMQNGDIKEFFGEDEFVTLNSKLKSWSDYLDDHYGLGKHSKSNLIKRVNKIKNKPLSDLNFNEIHSLIKYYKDTIKDKSELNNICNHLIDLSKDSSPNNYDNYVTKKFIIYSLNNQFSLVSEDNKTEDLDILHNEIESYQGKYNITNYFADKKYATIILNGLRKAYNERKYLGSLVSETNKLNTLKKILKRCKKRLDWSFRHHSLIFQMKYEDSLVPTQIVGFPGIYYASTFVLPIPKYSNTKEFHKLEIEYEKLTVLINSISALRIEFKELQELQENVEKTKDELKNNDFKSLEMISIFTAIITFIISATTGFKFITDFKQALFFFTILGGSLCLMVLSVFLIRKGKNRFAENWIAILCLLIMIVCAAAFFEK
ncbi:hypothetical protein [Tenacibaculum aquimarinum]|uniref:hypothetical protein n=1 Tax=Tenacibaculum aquimarinum TaxID=2910675 RepID=UPI001F0AE121|nr:hypothetical protein [Tenacibaculum aquimarinum]MCH3883487.1 hypothetical protein [Tenacibaculum aquimarinum]